VDLVTPQAPIAEPNTALYRARVNGEARLRNDLLTQIVASFTY